MTVVVEAETRLSVEIDYVALGVKEENGFAGVFENIFESNLLLPERAVHPPSIKLRRNSKTDNSKQGLRTGWVRDSTFMEQRNQPNHSTVVREQWEPHIGP